MRNIVSKSLEKLENDGLHEFSTSAISYISNEIKAKKAELRSPIEYNEVLVPTKNSAINRGAKIQILENDWEREEIMAVDKYYNNPFDIIDLGACTGFSTSYICKKFYNKITAVAVEANPNLVPVVRETRKINNLNFKILNKAYHSEQTNVGFHITNRIESGSLHKQSGKTVQVETTAIESLIASFELTNPVIIADIEGAEADMILNEIEVLENNCPLIITEFHEKYNPQVKEAKEIMNNSKFKKEEEIGDVWVYKNTALP